MPHRGGMIAMTSFDFSLEFCLSLTQETYRAGRLGYGCTLSEVCAMWTMGAI